MKKPDVQQELRSYAARLRMFGYPGAAAEVATHLERLASALEQRRPVTHGTPVSQRMTPALEQLIWEKHLDDPTKPQHVIARECGVNQGRVSEVLAGKRT